MDMELLPWLETYTFPEESKYGDLEYAKKAYEIFTEDLRRSATSRVNVFATIHREAAESRDLRVCGKGMHGPELSR